MSSVCDFEFDHPDLVYVSGEEIRGRAILKTTRPKNVKSIFVEFVGDAWVSRQYWKHRSTTHEEGVMDDEYFGHEFYVNTRLVVFTGSILKAGEHVFPFFVQLPPDCPSSCLAKYGSIRYKLRLVLERSLKPNQKFSQVLSVIRPFDCNLIKELKEPIQRKDSMSLAFWSTGVLAVALSIPQGGYTPGQDIEFTITTENKSAHEDFKKNLELKLKERYTYTIMYPKRRINNKPFETTQVLASTVIPMQCRHLSHCVLTGSVRIPKNLLPSSPDGIVARSYELQLLMRKKAFGKNQKIKLPIVIGTKPIHSNRRVNVITKGPLKYWT